MCLTTLCMQLILTIYIPVEFVVLLKHHKTTNSKSSEHYTFDKANYNSIIAGLKNIDLFSLFENSSVDFVKHITYSLYGCLLLQSKRRCRVRKANMFPLCMSAAAIKEKVKYQTLEEV